MKGPDDDPIDGDDDRTEDDADLMTTGTFDGPPKTEADEVYCTSCGETIKEKAAVCPECGVPQSVENEIDGMSDQQLSAAGIPPEKGYELRKLAQKNIGLVGMMGFLLSPVAYLMIGKKWWALFNFITFNYLFMGFLLVPIHTLWIIYSARSELDQAGVPW